jgi:two-component system, OmpR family, copper resistance phosphate regulon response regulator CusR
MRILIAEDDAALAGFVRQGLQGEHYSVEIAEDGEQARTMGSEVDYDLVILDLNLPRLDGVSVLRHLRLKRPSMPVLVLTLRSKVEDRVQCLDIGADDYLAKPFSYSELSARIRALLRRCHLPSESVLVVDDLKLDRVEHRTERAGRRIELTTKEFSLLEYLMRNAGRQVSRAMIIEHVWNLTFDTTTNVVDVYINYFAERADKLQVNALARSNVTFSRLNLSDDSRMTFMKSMDAIFCCNVLIYFDLASKRRVIQHFFNNLLPHGYLFLGHSESLYGVNEDFRLVHMPGATAYVKGERTLGGGKLL